LFQFEQAISAKAFVVTPFDKSFLIGTKSDAKTLAVGDVTRLALK
jgi:hypothetical protein